MKKFLFIFLLLFAANAHGQNDEMARLRKQIAQYEADIEAANKLIARSKKDQSTSESQLKVTRTQLAKRREMVVALGRQVAAIENEMGGKRKDISRLNNNLAQLKKDYAAMVYDAWKNQRHNDFLLFLFSADDFNAASRRADFMRRYNAARRDKAQQIVGISDTIRRRVSALDATRSELDATRAKETRQATTLAGDEKTYAARVKKLAADQKKAQKQIAEKQALRRKAQQQIDAIIAAEARRANASSASLSEADQRALAALSGRFEDNRGRLPYPITGGVVIDHFGEHANRETQSTQKSVTVNNKGVNMAGAGGAAVKSVFEGEVIFLGQAGGYNLCVLVRHGDYIAVYTNMASTAVRKGDKVTAGQLLGHIFNSSNPDDNFLHFEITRIVGGQTTPLDPELWLR